VRHLLGGGQLHLRMNTVLKFRIRIRSWILIPLVCVFLAVNASLPVRWLNNVGCLFCHYS
jgi:hypothetical protein